METEQYSNDMDTANAFDPPASVHVESAPSVGVLPLDPDLDIDKCTKEELQRLMDKYVFMASSGTRRATYLQNRYHMLAEYRKQELHSLKKQVLNAYKCINLLIILKQMKSPFDKSTLQSNAFPHTSSESGAELPVSETPVKPKLTLKLHFPTSIMSDYAASARAKSDSTLKKKAKTAAKKPKRPAMKASKVTKSNSPKVKRMKIHKIAAPRKANE